MNEYETFKKWVNSFDEKIYYKLKPLTKKELYEIAIKQEEEIKRLKESEEYHRKGYAELHKRIEEAIEYIEQYNDYFLLKREVKELLSILKGVKR